MFLRLSENDGIVCRKASARFVTLISIFGLRRHELEYLPEQSLEILEVMMDQHRIAELEPEENGLLATHYEILGCEPDCSDSELRGAFRKLAKKYHPDTSISDNKSSENLKSKTGFEKNSGKQFQEIVDAFQEITRAREVGGER